MGDQGNEDDILKEIAFFFFYSLPTHFTPDHRRSAMVRHAEPNDNNTAQAKVSLVNKMMRIGNTEIGKYKEFTRTHTSLNEVKFFLLN